MTFRDDNGNELEFGGEFAMTKQAVSFFNGQIKGDVSINFTVDNNSVNRKVLNYYGPQMTSQVAFTKQAFNRVRNGNILDRGFIVIQSEEGDKLSCFYVSGNSNWLQLLTPLINTLNWNYDTGGTSVVPNEYPFRKPLLESFISEDNDKGIIFPMVDWAYNFKMGSNYFYSDNLYDMSGANFFLQWYPCLYMSSLVEQIGIDTGFKFSGSLMTDLLFNRMVLTPTSGQIKRAVSLPKIYLSGASEGSFAKLTPKKYNSFTVVSDPKNQFSNGIYTQSHYGYTSFTITLVATTAVADAEIRLYKNGVSTSFGASGFYAGTVATFQAGDTSSIPGDRWEVYITSNDVLNRSFTLNMSISTNDILGEGDTVTPNDFLPSLNSLEVIKYLISLFGCSVYLNEYSKTISLNIIENIKTETALDWSDYYLGHRSEYTVNQGKNNYINYAKSSESDPNLNRYDKSNIVNYGSGNITTGNTLKTENVITEFPFGATESQIAKNGILMPNVPLINLIDDTAIEYTSIVNLGGGSSRYVFASGPTFEVGEVVRISNANHDKGYFIVYGEAATRIDVQGDPFVVTNTGFIYKQRINYNTISPRVLVVKPSTNIADFSSSSSYFRGNVIPLSISTETLTHAATFTKPAIGDTIDQWKANLAIDNPNSGGFTDPTIKQLYFNKISKFLQNPNIRAKMLLPEAVYQSFVFDQFIYLRTENLTGYFFVDSIVNYVDGNTPVEVNLYML